MTLAELTINDAGEFVPGARVKCPCCKGATSTLEPSRQALSSRRPNPHWVINNCPKCGKTQLRSQMCVELPDPEPEPAPEHKPHVRPKRG
jgi:hypothetical protein